MRVSFSTCSRSLTSSTVTTVFSGPEPGVAFPLLPVSLSSDMNYGGKREITGTEAGFGLDRGTDQVLQNKCRDVGICIGHSLHAEHCSGLLVTQVLELRLITYTLLFNLSSSMPGASLVVGLFCLRRDLSPRALCEDFPHHSIPYISCALCGHFLSTAMPLFSSSVCEPSCYIHALTGWSTS